MGLQHIEQPHADILSVVGRATSLHKKTARELAGPCPVCGGSDRFVVFLADNTWFCRQCHPRRSDPAAFLMWFEGLRYPEACERLGGLPAMPMRTYEPPALTDEQRQTFMAITNTCHPQLGDEDRPLTWLHARGISGQTIIDWRLGYNPGRWDSTTAVAGCRVPCGITIPLIGVDSLLYGLSVRRALPATVAQRDVPKYQCVTGSRVPLFGKPPTHTTCLLVEGYFDCILLDRIAGDLIDVAALGSAKGSIDSQWYPYLLSHATWLICMDNDNAGQKAEQGWAAMSERARILHCSPSAKDITLLWQQHATEAGEGAADAALRGWIEEGGSQ